MNPTLCTAKLKGQEREKGAMKMFPPLIKGEICPVSSSELGFGDKKSAVNETFEDN